MVICSPETFKEVSSAAALLNLEKAGKEPRIQVVCLSKTDDCQNLEEMSQEVKAEDAPEPAVFEDLSKERLVVFWSSGTTGKDLRLLSSLESWVINICSPFQDFQKVSFEIINLLGTIACSPVNRRPITNLSAKPCISFTWVATSMAYHPCCTQITHSYL